MERKLLSGALGGMAVAFVCMIGVMAMAIAVKSGAEAFEALGLDGRAGGIIVIVLLVGAIAGMLNATETPDV